MRTAAAAGTDASRAAFRSFVDEVVIPRAGNFDLAGAVPPDVVAEVAARGYLGAVLPDGPLPLDMVGLGALHEEIGRGCSSLRSLLTVHSMVAFAVHRWGGDAARERWLGPLADGSALGAFCLTESGAGSDASGLAATAEEDSRGGYVLTGHKKWITCGQVADVLLVFARTGAGIGAFLVEAADPAVRRTPVRSILGTRASMLAEITLTGCRVGPEALVGGPGTGLNVITGALDVGRYSVAAGCVGIAQGCLEVSAAHAATRHQGGALLKDHQLVRRMITRMAVDTEAARLLCLRAGRLKDEGDPATLVATCAAKYFAAGVAARAASDAVQVHGAVGCVDGHPAARYYRDAKVMEIIEGSSQVHENLIAEDVCRTAGAPRSESPVVPLQGLPPDENRWEIA